MRALAFVLLLLGGGALAQEAPGQASQNAPQNDVPIGAPYRVGTDAAVPLRDFMSIRIDVLRQELLGIMDERERKYNERVSNANEALRVALASINERLANVNEFRSTLTDQQKTFVTRDLLDALSNRFTEALDRMTSLGTRITTIESSGGPVTQQLQTQLTSLSTRLTEIESRTAGASSLGSWIFTAIGALAGAVGAYLALSRRGDKVVR